MSPAYLKAVRSEPRIYSKDVAGSEREATKADPAMAEDDIDLLYELYARYASGSATIQPKEVADSSSPPHDPEMESRIVKLETTLETIRAEMRANSAELRGEMRASAAELKAEMASFKATVQGSMDGMRTDAERLRGDVIGRIAESERSLTRWFITTAIVVILGIAGLWMRSAPTAAPQASPPPVIINVPAPAAQAQPSPSPAP